MRHRRSNGLVDGDGAARGPAIRSLRADSFRLEQVVPLTKGKCLLDCQAGVLSGNRRFGGSERAGKPEATRHGARALPMAA